MENSLEQKPLTIIRQTLARQNEQGRALMEVVDHIERIEQNMIEMNGDTRALLKKVSDSVTLNYEEQSKYKSAVSSMSHSLAKKYFGDSDVSRDFYLMKVGQIRSRIYSRVKTTFNVPRYSAIKRIDFDNAVQFVNRINLESFEDWEIRLTPRQKEIAEMNNDEISIFL